MDAPTPDVTDMHAVHRVFRDTLSAAPSLVVEGIEPERTALVSNFYANVLQFLKVHHEGEEELVFPLLRERCPAELAIVERAESQHEDVVDLVAQSTAGLELLDLGDTTAVPQVAVALSQLGQTMTEHLDNEEATILPLCAEHLSMEEWGQLPGHGMRNFGGDKIWLILGLIRERMTQQQRDLMLAHMPPPAVQMWTGFGEDAFNNLMVQVGAPLR